MRFFFGMLVVLKVVVTLKLNSMSNKHDVNVRKNTLINFQIGLIASLLFAYVTIEMYTAVSIVDIPKEPFDPPVENFNLIGEVRGYEETKEKVVIKTEQKKVVEPEEFKVVDDSEEIKTLINEFVNTPVKDTEPFDINTVTYVEESKPVKKVPFIAVEEVPVFPGCEKLETNTEKAACFSSKIKRWVSKKFNAGLGEKYGLNGKQKIDVQFEVGKDGLIQNIKVRAPHKALKKEALRVAKSFPRMTPGKQRGESVSVIYQLPIVFKIQN